MIILKSDIINKKNLNKIKVIFIILKGFILIYFYIFIKVFKLIIWLEEISIFIVV